MGPRKNYFLAVSSNGDYLPALAEVSAQNDAELRPSESGAQAFKAILASPPAVAFLDAALPDISAAAWLTILRSMKEGKNLPVVVIGGRLGPEETAGYFEQGADDCIPLKDCDPRELSARLRAVLRRRYGLPEKEQAPLTAGPVTLDLAAHRCYAGGREIPLRPREFELLEVLVKKAGRVLGRPYLLEFVWGMASSADTRAVDVTVSRLRRALGPKAGRWVGSVAKFGYRFAPPGKDTDKGT